MGATQDLHLCCVHTERGQLPHSCVRTTEPVWFPQGMDVGSGAGGRGSPPTPLPQTPQPPFLPPPPSHQARLLAAVRKRKRGSERSGPRPALALERLRPGTPLKAGELGEHLIGGLQGCASGSNYYYYYYYLAIPSYHVNLG